VHGVDLNSDYGEIQSPGYPVGLLSNQPPYTWTITVSGDKYVQAAFYNMELPQSNLQNAECYRYVALYDGPDSTSPELGRYCGHATPEPVHSSSNVITVVFNPQDFFEGRFYLWWHRVTTRPPT